MRNRIPRTAIIAAVLIGLILSTVPLHVAQADDPVKIRVEITDDGFKGSPDGGDFVINVEQGKLVELTFVWAHDRPSAFPESAAGGEKRSYSATCTLKRRCENKEYNQRRLPCPENSAQP